MKISDVVNMANTCITVNILKEKSSGCSHYKRRALFVVRIINITDIIYMLSNRFQIIELGFNHFYYQSLFF